MTYNLNLVPGKVPVAVHVKQYDTAPREVTFNLHYGDAVYTIPSSVTITVSGTKPDGNGFAYNVTDFSGSTVTVPMQEQMTVLAGEIPCQLTIAQTSGVIGTATFMLCVEPAALSSDTPVSDTDLAAFQQMLTQTQQEAAGVAGATAQIATNASNIATNTAAISQLNSKTLGIRGQIGTLTSWNIDQMAVNESYGVWWLNNYDSDVAGTKPVSSGQGLLFCERQNSNVSRQLYIGATASVKKVRYYTHSTGVWTAWEDCPGTPLTASWTGTPSANGNLSHSFGANVIVLSAWTNTSDTVVMPYPTGRTTTGGSVTWWFHVRSASSAHAVVTSSVTITACYILV